jgi:hypothetical protein
MGRHSVLPTTSAAIDRQTQVLPAKLQHSKDQQTMHSVAAMPNLRQASKSKSAPSITLSLQKKPAFASRSVQQGVLHKVVTAQLKQPMRNCNSPV